jgi:deoxyadenosine/deoxycytidine kinase
MTRHESRRPSPKVTGPNDPDANLRKRARSWVSTYESHYEERYARQYVHIRRQPYEEYFDEMRFCSVLNVNGMDTYQVGDCASRIRGIPRNIL